MDDPREYRGGSWAAEAPKRKPTKPVDAVMKAIKQLPEYERYVKEATTRGTEPHERYEAANSDPLGARQMDRDINRGVVQRAETQLWQRIEKDGLLAGNDHATVQAAIAESISQRGKGAAQEA